MTTVGIEVYGVKDAIKELRTIDPEYRKQLTRDVKIVAEPVTSEAKSNYPSNYLSGMKFRWAPKGSIKFPYDQGKAQKGVSVKIDTRRGSEGTIVITQKDPAAAIIDMAGKRGGSGKRGESFTSNLSRFGPPSRVMWPAYEHHADEVEKNMAKIVEGVMDQVNRNMVTA